MATVTPSSRSTRWAERELDRVAAFSDGVFAIAITLLVLNLAVPTVPDDQPGHALRALRDDFTAYLIGFAVMGGFWYGHHRLFSRMKRSNPRLVVANLVLLALIGLMPFTTALLGRYDEPLAIAIYAVNVGLASLADGATGKIAIDDGLLDDESVAELGEADPLIGSIARAGVFFLSIPIAYLVAPNAALWSWLLLIPLGVALGRRHR
jgi:uncharacterized membrane protein